MLHHRGCIAHALTLKISVMVAEYICGFCVILTIKSRYFFGTINLEVFFVRETHSASYDVGTVRVLGARNTSRRCRTGNHKVVLAYDDMKVYRESSHVVPLILNLDSRWK